MNSDNLIFLKLLINICTLVSVSFAIIISLFIIIYVFVIYYTRYHSKNSFNVSLLLTCNTYVAIICSSIMHILTQLSIMSSDHNLDSFKWIIYWGCHIRGYLLFVFVNSIYLSYVLQAGYRLFRIVFHEYRCLQTVSSFSYYILALWMISFITLMPILFTGENFTISGVYLPEEFYCQVPITNIFIMFYSAFIVYIIPLCCLSVIYFWIIIYIRRNTKYRQSVFMLRFRHQNKRDRIIMKRIWIIMSSLWIQGLPSFILLIVFVISGNLYWTFYRLSWMIVSLSYAFICLSSIYVTPDIYRPIKSRFGFSKHHPINPQDSISINRNIKAPMKTDHSILPKTSSIIIIELETIQRKTSHT